MTKKTNEEIIKFVSHNSQSPEMEEYTYSGMEMALNILREEFQKENVEKGKLGRQIGWEEFNNQSQDASIDHIENIKKQISNSFRKKAREEDDEIYRVLTENPNTSKSEYDKDFEIDYEEAFIQALRNRDATIRALTLKKVEGWIDDLIMIPLISSAVPKLDLSSEQLKQKLKAEAKSPHAAKEEMK